MIDLHIHTTASDGQYSPTEIIEKAASKKMAAIAITDHDNIEGLEEGKKAAEELGVNLIPGVEINIQNHGGEFHLLGLGFTEYSDSLIEVLSKLKKDRDDRNFQVMERIKAEWPDFSMEEILADNNGSSLGRPHFAAYLVKKGVVKTRQQAFDRYLAKGRPWYVERSGANLDEAIVAIKESGGAPVIAHPMSLFLSWGKLPDFLRDIYERGVVGLEAFHPGARVTECLRLDELGRQIGFFITAGSDFHGEKIRADRRIGYTCGGKKIEDSIWEEGLKVYLDGNQK